MLTKFINRSYESVLKKYLVENRQMIFIAGPRQVGKTTLCKKFSTNYINWDNQNHRQIILEGPDAIAETFGLNVLKENQRVIVFDKIHKYSKWKNFLKGFFDSYASQTKIIVTGSSKLDIYQKGGDSLMGRYFLYRLHPLSVREIVNSTLDECTIQKAKLILPDSFNALYQFGGYPEPFLKAKTRFFNQWRRLRNQQLLSEDVRDLTQIQEINQLEILSNLLIQQAGQLINYSNLAQKINVSVDSIRRWLKVLESLYYCFTISPWTFKVSRSLLKQPKIYLWDWSIIKDKGAKAENFVALHLLKAVHWWIDNGYGEYRLHFLRDKEKREVDFLVSRDNQPWFLVEVKTGSSRKVSKSLYHFQELTQCKHAFQVSFSEDFVDADCFSMDKPTIVPITTLMSQLV
jgi:hypothetical protein